MPEALVATIAALALFFGTRPRGLRRVVLVWLERTTSRIDQALCHHETVWHFEDGRACLRCLHCDYETPGLEWIRQ